MFDNDTPKEKIAFRLEEIAIQLKELALLEEKYSDEEYQLLDFADKIEHMADFLARG